jgi:sulfite exporter TauE/SafE
MLSAALLSALLMGMIGSTHCVGMCGGIISTLSTNLGSQTGSYRPSVIQLFYNLGRIASYSLIGLLTGLFSSQLMQLLPDPHLFSMKISGIFFILLGLYISQFLNSFKYLERAGHKLWVKIEPFGRKYLPAQDYWSALKLGLVWGWLPCGLVYSALALAVTQTNPLHSALTMLAFGIGTLPTLLLIGHFALNVKTMLQSKKLRWLLGLLLVAYGLLFSVYDDGASALTIA